MKNVINVFIKYIRQYIALIIVFAVFCGILFAVTLLYDVNTEPLLYSCFLFVILLFVILPVHFFIYYKKHAERQQLLKNIDTLTNNLPVTGNLVEQDYKQIINSLMQLNKDATTKFQNNRQDNIDYYTTWVHQIKTPISIIKMILQSEDTAENRELLAQLFRIEQYVEMVLCYIRLDSSNDFVIKKQSLDSIIKQAVRRYAPQFVRKRLSLKYNPTEVLVLTDEKWLLFIIEQLLDNAIKYTEKGSIKITVTYDNILKISDTGIGIAPEDLPRIFEKGFTGYNGRADKKSTGLGLYLCQKAAQRLSHNITAVSQPGSGSEFSIDLKSYNFTAE